MSSAAVNGLCYTNGWSTAGSDLMAPQTSSEEYIQFSFGTYTWSGEIKIRDFYDVEQYTDIEFVFEVRDENYAQCGYKVVNVYPYGEDAVIRYKYEMKDTDKVVIDNEYATVLVTGYEQTEEGHVVIKMFILNKLEEPAWLTISSCDVNGERIFNIGSWNIGGGQCILTQFMMMYVGDLENIETIEWKNFAMSGIESASLCETYFEEESIILNP